MPETTTLFYHVLIIALGVFSASELIKSAIVINTPNPTYLALLAGIFIYYNYQLHRSLFALIETYQARKARLAQEKVTIEAFLKDKLNYTRSEDISTVLIGVDGHNFHSRTLAKYGKQLSEQLLKAKRLQEILKHEETLARIISQKEQAQMELQSISETKRRATMTEEEMMERIKEKMDLDNHPVFIKEDLSEQQVEILKNEGYTNSNQYSPCEERMIDVFVRPVLNHSIAHTFLVWDIISLLDVFDMENVKEHRTVDADITFKHNNKMYAIEVETGNLLKKPKQLKDKVTSLNKKYPNRWLFVVSNKNLLPKYKKHGPATQRSQVEKTIKKWLKIDTQEIGVEKLFLGEQ